MLWNRDERLDSSTGGRFDARVLRMVGVCEKLAWKLARARLDVFEHRLNASHVAARVRDEKANDRPRAFYTIAIGSATESAAMLDLCLRRQLIASEAHDRGKQLLDRIVAMLVKLCRALRDG
jgi:hypothetical protein